MEKLARSKSCDEHCVDAPERNSAVPTELTEDEYADLEAQVATLSEEEAREDWMDSCRYGEIDIVRALLFRFPSLVNYRRADNGNTGMHMAAANGHIEVVKLLVDQNHSMSTNKAGNSPLHWAAERGQAEVVQFLTTEKTQDIDVLQKNEFGRSILTEGFASQNELVVKSLLEHDSASEEKLLSTDKNSASEVTHSFFDRNDPLLARELAITNADNPFADLENPDNDTTGLSIWAASVVLARWLGTKSWDGLSVLELGAGCGVPGLAIARANRPPKQVFVTDLNPRAVENLRHNVGLNKLTNTTALRMDWNDTTTWPEAQVDCVIGSDLVYQKSLVPILVKVILKITRPGGSFLYVAPTNGRAGLDEFVAEMKKLCVGWKETDAPDDLISNPLSNQDEEDCFLHFHELSALKFVLYDFPIPAQP